MALNIADQPIAGNFKGKSIISVSQFARRDIEILLSEAAAMRGLVGAKGGGSSLRGTIIANLFYEPSTRTFASFAAAAQRLGAGILPIQGVEYSSVAKGESLEDTARSLACYADVIVLRHPEIGSAAQAAAVLDKPLINAGDGAGEHPTQALLDIYTIMAEAGRLDNLTVTLVGDLNHGRTVHSLVCLLALFGAKLQYVSPDNLRMPGEITAELHKQGISQSETNSLDEVIGTTDVLYATRVQKERFDNLAEYEKHKDAYVITPELMKGAKAQMVLMHPLPRVGEIHTDVDTDPRAAYFRQMEYGMYVRMALLALVLGKSEPSLPLPEEGKIEAWEMTIGATS